MALSTILLIVLVLAVVGALPAWGYHQYGYAPAGGIGLVLVILLILILAGRL